MGTLKIAPSTKESHNFLYSLDVHQSNHLIVYVIFFKLHRFIVEKVMNFTNLFLYLLSFHFFFLRKRERLFILNIKTNSNYLYSFTKITTKLIVLHNYTSMSIVNKIL